MKGHIRERSPGRWAIVLDVVDSASGRKKRKWFSFKGNKRGAQEQCAHLITASFNGAYVEPGKLTTGEFVSRWLAHIETQVSPSSHKTYTTMLSVYAMPAIGSIMLAKLRPDALAKLYADVLKSGSRRRRGGLSPKSVALLHRVLFQALRQAVRWQLLATNPAAAAVPPRIERRPMHVPGIDAALALVEATRGTDLFAPVLLATMTGMRRGEILALRWRSVDLDAGRLAVVSSVEQVGIATRDKPPKSGRSRSVALPDLLVEELRRHRLRQAEGLLRLGVRQDGETHVATRCDGSPWRPSVFTQAFARLLNERGMARTRFHDLRHAHASHLLAANVHPKVVSERLGHSSIGITLDVYSHVAAGMQEQAAATIDCAMRAARGRGAKE
jgi:integrase